MAKDWDNPGDFQHGNKAAKRRELSPHAQAIANGKDLAQIARDKLTVPAIDRLLEILTDPATKHSDLISAARLAFDRGWGTAPQRIEITTDDDLDKLDSATLRAIAAGAVIDGEAEQIEH